jgi:hypothetical protein
MFQNVHQTADEIDKTIHDIEEHILPVLETLLLGGENYTSPTLQKNVSFL